MGQYGTYTLKLYLPLKNYLQPQTLKQCDSCLKCNSCCRKFMCLYKGPVTVADLIRIVDGTEVPIWDSEYYRYGWRDPKEVGDQEVHLRTGYSYCAIRIKSPAVRFTDEEYAKIITVAKRRNGILAPLVYTNWEVACECLVTKPEIKWQSRTVNVEGRLEAQACKNAKDMLENDPDCEFAQVIKAVQTNGEWPVQVFNVKCADCKHCEYKDGIYFCKGFGVNVDEYESCEKGEQK